MKLSLVLTALLGALPYLAYGSAIPAPIAANELIASGPVEASADFLSKRADDEWELVIFDGGKPGQQCGGTSHKHTGKKDTCAKLGNLKGSVCANIKVEAHLPFTKCEFSFKAEGDKCGGKTEKSVTVEKGHDSNGVELNTDVKFVTVHCTK